MTASNPLRADREAARRQAIRVASDRALARMLRLVVVIAIVMIVLGAILTVRQSRTDPDAGQRPLDTWAVLGEMVTSGLMAAWALMTARRLRRSSARAEAGPPEDSPSPSATDEPT